MNPRSFDRFLQRTDRVIDDILGGSVSETEKEELLDSFYYIYRKYTRELQNSAQMNENSRFYTTSPFNYAPNVAPSLNIYIVNPNQPTMPNIPYNYLQYQNPSTPNMIVNSPPPLSEPINIKKKSDKKSKSSKKSKSDKKSKGDKKKKSKEIYCKYNSSSPFKGIMDYLTSVASRNPSDAGLVTIDASSEQHGELKKIIEPGYSDYFSTSDSPQQWIKFTFKDYLISMNGYSMKTHSVGGNGHSRSWRVEGSMDGNSWTVIHSVNNSDALTTIGAVYSTDLPKYTSYFKQIKFTQIGPNNKSFHNFRMTGIELFGKLKKDKSVDV